jgi:phage gp36-like protein
MAYCTYQDILIDVFPRDLIELTDDNNESTALTPFSAAMISLINSFIAKADAIINDYSRGNYTTPFSTVPETIKNISVALATYFIFSRPRDLEEDNPKRQRYDDAMKMLTKINEGKIILDVDPTPETDNVIGISINKTASDRFFPKTTLSQMP